MTAVSAAERIQSHAQASLWPFAGRGAACTGLIMILNPSLSQ